MIEHSHRFIEPLALATTFGGAASAGVLWGLQVSDLGVIVSMLIAGVGLTVNIWATLRRERREREQHRLLMETLRNGSKTSNPRASGGDSQGC